MEFGIIILNSFITNRINVARIAGTQPAIEGDTAQSYKTKNKSMNSQTITTRANANHFGHNAAQNGTTKKQNSTPVQSLVETPTGNGQPHSGVKADQTIEVVDPNHPASLPDASGKSAPNEQLKETVFRLDAPSAREVLLAADFTDWDKTPVKMIKGGGGVWHVKVPLSHGRHLYRFIVDGEWRDDPAHSERVANNFGSFNSVINVV